MLILQLLGSPQIRLNEAAIAVRSAKARALLFYLAVQSRVHSRSSLAGLLWPEMTEADARTNLRQAIYHLHQSIPNCLSATRDSLKCSDQYTLTVDALRFVEAAALGLQLSGEGAQAALRTAAALYQGEFLAGFYVEEALPYEEWLLAQREQLYRQAFQVLQRLTALALAQQNVYEGLHYAQRLLALEPWREESHFQLMQLLALNGQTQAALAQYEACRQLLDTELGVPPSPALKKLAEEIRRGKLSPLPTQQSTLRVTYQQPSTVAAPLPTASTRSAEFMSKPRHNLPAPLSSFVGRKGDLVALEQMFTIPAIRLVSLVGPGGVGKTRLANQVGLQLLPAFRDGVWLVDLVAVSDAALLAQAVTNIFALHPRPQQTPLESLRHFLVDKQMLLLFDNCEHLLEAAALLAAALLTAAPQLKILATSREALHITGEQCVAVAPLALPPAQPPYSTQQLLTCDSVQLFVERAAAQSRTFVLSDANAAAVARICRLLDGIPLAIELVAARSRSLSAQEMAAQLARTPDARWQLVSQGPRDAHPRHQTLLNLLNWSYELLQPAERLLFARLAVFAGHWSLAAAEVIGGDEPQPSPTLPTPREQQPTCSLTQSAVFDLLTALVNKSLVVAEPGADMMRYRYLETLRHFALNRLAATGEVNRLRDRHLHYFLHFMEEQKAAQPNLPGAMWQARIAPELDNLRTALAWALESGAAAVGLRLALLASDFWFSQGFHREAVHWVERLLTLPAAAAEKQLRLVALSTIGFMQWWVLGSYAQARTLQQEALLLAQELGDQDRIEKTLNNLGGVALHTGDYAAACGYLHQSLALTAQSGNALNRAWSALLLGEVLLAQQQWAEATRHFGEAARLLRWQQRRSLLAYPVRRLGQIAFLGQNLPVALTHYEESLALNLAVGGVEGKAACVAAYATLFLHIGCPEQATLLWAAVATVLQTSQSQLTGYDEQMYRELTATLQSRLDESSLRSAWATGCELTLEQAVALIHQWQVQPPVAWSGR